METEEAINLVIKTINNDVYNIRVTNSTPITRLKDAICETTSIENERQRLIYRGKVLTDESFIRDYNIEDGHTVHMVARPSNFREIQQTVNTPPARDIPANPNNTTVPLMFRPSATLPSFTSLSALREPDNRREATEEITNTPQSVAEPSLEYIRQGLLTMHTLFSTISSVPIPSNTPDSGNITESKPSATESSNDTQLTSERKFFVGQWLDVKDTVSQWLEATVLDIDNSNRRVFVHYNGWPQRWDEWITFDSPRIAPFRSRTSHPALSSNLSPTPNISVSHAPPTGSNDIRTILPELANVFRMLQPVVEELGALSEESLRYDQTSHNASVTYARGMPWDRFLSDNQPSHSAESKENSSEYAPGEKYMDSADVKDSAIPVNSPRSQREIDERLQLLTRDACPLFDRFGRLLSDLSPHLWTRAMPGITRPAPANRFDPFQSLEARLLSLLRERPPSPPPIQSYRAPITSQGPRMIEPMDILRGGLLRGSTQTTSSEENDNTSSTTNNIDATSRAAGSNSNNRRSGLEHHLDIHIAILSPPSSTTVSNSNPSRPNNAQAQNLAARTQELSQRTSAVSEITSAITEALRNNGNTTSTRVSTTSNTTESNDNNDNNNLNNNQQSIPVATPLVSTMTNTDDHHPDYSDDSEDSALPSLAEPPTSEELLEDLNLPPDVNHHEEINNSSLMPNNEDQAAETPFYNISNRRLHADYGTNENTNEAQSSSSPNEIDESPTTNPSHSSSSFLQRLRRSFFSSNR